MIRSLRAMLRCRWAARRIQRYLDADPSAPLSAREIARLEAHLEVCAVCSSLTAQHRTLHRALSLLPGASAPEPDALERLQQFVTDLTTDDDRRQ